MSDNNFSLTPEQFGAVTMVVQRVAILLSRVAANKSTGPEVAVTVAEAAGFSAIQVDEMLTHVAGSNREDFARDMGWPSADELEQFLFNGAAFGRPN